MHLNSKLNILGQKHVNSFICLLKWLKFQNPGYITENASCELILIVSPNLFDHYIILNNISTLFNECSPNLARNVNVNRITRPVRTYTILTNIITLFVLPLKGLGEYLQSSAQVITPSRVDHKENSDVFINMVSKCGY